MKEIKFLALVLKTKLVKLIYALVLGIIVTYTSFNALHNFRDLCTANPLLTAI